MDRRDFLATAGQAVFVAAVALTGSARDVLAMDDAKHYPIPPSDGVTIDRDNQVILVRTGGQVMAFNLSCPHENSALRWRQEIGQFFCSTHESQYTPVGQFITGRATRDMDRLGITRAGNEVVVDLSRTFRSDLNPAEYAAAVVTLG